VDRAVIATATELFGARHYPGVVALVSDALDEEPESVPLLLLRARAQIALRRDLDAQADLRDIIRLDPHCASAYRLLGELSARRNENASAAIFFREALRLTPDDRDAADWLAIVEQPARPAAAATQLPAPAAAAGRFPIPRLAKGTNPPADVDVLMEHDPDDSGHTPLERPTAPFTGVRPPHLPVARGSSRPARSSPGGEAATIRGAQPLHRPLSQPRPMRRSQVPELPGFGDYLVETGILTRERLRAAQAYQRSMKVQLSTAIVTLGLATPQRIEWAAVAHQSQIKR
jgi:tetratricopeptide (TPR) repeat protein